MFEKVDILLLDAANTIIHKPKLWTALLGVLHDHKFKVSEHDLKLKHKLLSEVIHFPDRTDASFYRHFNHELLLLLGIIPTDTLLDEIFSACTYLPWEPFDDAKIISEMKVDIAVLSNFKNTLNKELIGHFGDIFKHVITSEEAGVSKPDIKFYQRAVDLIDVSPDKILYIGDSLKLDIIPAKKLGIKAILIDREDVFPYYESRISSFHQLPSLLNE